MAVTINGSTGVQCTDDVKQKFGTGDDLEIYHQSSNNASYIKEGGSGNLYIFSENLRIENADGSESYIEANANGAVELYYNGIRQAVTDTAGMEIKTGDTSIDTEFIIRGNEAKNATLRLICDDGDDNADNWRLQANANTYFYLANYGDGSYETNILAKPGAEVQLYYDNSKKIETSSGGVKVTGIMQAYVNEGDSDYTASSWHVLQSNDNNSSAVIIEHSGDTNPYGLYMDFSDASPDNHTNRFIHGIDSSGNARFTIYSDGDVWTSDDSYLSSDNTLKENIVDATSKLEDLKKLKVRNFNWKESYHPEKSKKKQLGFIAQEVEEVFPGLVEEHDIASSPENNHTPVMKKAIKQAWSPIIIKAMQELIAKVETLETEKTKLQTDLTALTARVAALEAA